MFCQKCGSPVKENQFCTKCGTKCVVASAQPTVVVNNYNTNTNANVNAAAVPVGRRRDKWAAFLLCLFLGGFGAHKFYEGKVGMGILYLLTFGLFGFGALIDLIVILCKPNPYYV